MQAMQCTVQSTFISLSFQPSNRENHTTLFCEKSSLLSLESCFYNFTLLKVQTISSTPDAAGSALHVANGGRVLEGPASRGGAGPASKEAKAQESTIPLPAAEYEARIAACVSDGDLSGRSRPAAAAAVGNRRTRD